MTRGKIAMAPNQLQCRDIKQGDIMLQHSSGNLTGAVIGFGEFLFGHRHSNLVHAGIMFDSSYMIEALMQGIVGNDIRVGNRSATYDVFRPRLPLMATIAGNLAKLFFETHAQVGNLHYSWGGAVASIGGARSAKSATDIDAMVDKMFGAKKSQFFCSQFVVITYQIAGGQLGMAPASVLPFDDARVAPARLAEMLEASPHFTRVGTMASGVR